MIHIDSAIITDANVLIDLFKADKGILQLICRELKEVIVPLLVLEEVNGLTLEEAEALGITVVDTEVEILENAGKLTGGIMNGLSFQDKICLFTALKGNYICITNDKKLQKICREKGVQSLWELELILFLYQKKSFTKDDALKTLKNISSVNNRVTPVVIHKFMKQLNS